MQRKHLTLLLVIILSIAFFIRFLFVWNNPVSMYWDEVSQANNANFILQTGYDEHHEFLPIARFVAYGDYKAPVYIYLIVPFMALLGKTILAVRMPSVLFGTLTVYVTYLLVRELFFSDKKRDLYALISAFFLAISPWHIQLSRAAYEGNVATFFSVLGVFLFLLALRKQAWIFCLSAVSFVLAMYAFNSYRIFVPLLVVFLGLLFFKEIIKRKKQVIFATVLGVILLIPFIQFLRTPESRLRYQEVNIFSDTKIVEKSNQDIKEEGNTLFAKVIHNRRILYSLSYIHHYLDFFSPDFLFIHGDVNPRFSVQEVGELYVFELPLVLVGVYFLVTRRTKSTYLIFGWLLLAPIAGATARETPHALRGETIVPMYELLAGIGIIFLSQAFARFQRSIRYGACAVGMGIIVLSVFFFQYVYYVDYPYLYSGVWQDGYKETIEKVNMMQSKYKKIEFTDYYGRSYAYLLFYTKTTPEDFWRHSTMVKDQFGLYNVYSMGKYSILSGVAAKIIPEKNVLYVVPPSDVKPWMKILDVVKLHSNQPGFIIATT